METDRDLKELVGAAQRICGRVINQVRLDTIISKIFSSHSVAFTQWQANSAAAALGFSGSFDRALVGPAPRDERAFVDWARTLQEKVLERTGLSTGRVIEFLRGVGAGVLEALGEDVERLRRLAADGMQIAVESSWVPDRDLELRRLYSSVSGAVDFVMQGKAQQGTAVAFDSSQGLPPFMHVSPAHWVAKTGGSGLKSQLGREVVDWGGTSRPLNSPEAKVSADDAYGKLANPSVEDIARSIVECRRKAVEQFGPLVGPDLVMSVRDVKNAFGRMRIDPKHVAKMGVQLAGEITVALLFAGFGYTGFPMAWGVVTRVLLTVCGAMMWGSLIMYVDDFFTVTHRSKQVQDWALVDRKSRQLLGEDAFEGAKDVYGQTRVNYIGWLLDCKYMWVAIGDRLLHKILWTLLVTDFTAQQPLELVQRVAAWLSRVATIFRTVHALTAVLHYEVQRGVTAGHRTVTLSERARSTLAVWRGLILLSAVSDDEDLRYRRSLYSFMPPAPPTSQISFDGCPEGCGAVLWRWDGSSEAWRPVRAASIRFPFELRHLSGANQGQYDSGYQNYSELAGVVVGLVLMVEAGLAGSSFRVVGDSRVAVRWAETSRFKGDRTRKMALIFSHLLCRYGLECGEAMWRPKEENELEDTLSRDFSPEGQRAALASLDCVGSVPLEDLDSASPRLVDMVWLSNPTVTLPEGEAELFEFLASVRTL